MKKALIVFLLSIFCSGLWSQDQTVVISGQFYLEDEPVNQEISGRLGDFSFTSNENGAFEAVVLRPKKTKVTPMVINGKFNIEYPLKGMITIENIDHQEIIIKLSTIHPTVDQSISFYDDLEILLDEKLNLEEIIHAMQGLLDKHKSEITRTVTDRINEILNEEKKLQDLVEKLEDLKKNEQIRRRSEVLKSLSSVLDHYVSRAEDLSIAFRDRGAKAFYNEQVVHFLNNSMANYNPSYESLNARHQSIIVDARNCFENPLIAERDFQEVLEFALHDVHDMVIKKFNLVVTDIDNFNNSRRRKERRKKREIISDIDEFVATLDQVLSRLEKKISDLYGRYKSQLEE